MTAFSSSIGGSVGLEGFSSAGVPARLLVAFIRATWRLLSRDIVWRQSDHDMVWFAPARGAIWRVDRPAPPQLVV